MRKAIMWVILGLLWVLSGRSGDAAELVMFESPGCPWCAAWHAEIGPIYPKTREGRQAPLRRVNVGDPLPADLAFLRGIHFTPTFVLVENGREIGRIHGYPGEAFFWGLLDELLGKLPRSATPAAAF